MRKVKNLCGFCMLFLVTAVIPVNAQSTINHIQSKISNSSTYVANQSVTLSSDVTSGNLIVVAVSAYTGTNADITTITDNKGNTYSRAIKNPAVSNGQHTLSIWYAKNVIGGNGFTVTATPAGNSYVTVAVHEYRNASIDNVLDQTSGNNGSTAFATSSNTGMTSQANELVFGAFMHQAASNPLVTSGDGFTQRESLTNGTYEPLITEDKNVSATSTYAATLTWGTAITWRGVSATFRATDASQPPIPTILPSPTIAPTETPAPTDVISVTPIPTGIANPTSSDILEPFEGATNNWQTSRDTSGTGSITQSANYFYDGSNSAHANTLAANSSAMVRVSFSDPAANHAWEERPGTFHWQHARIYIPSSTVNQLSGSEYFTLGGMWASEGGHAWYLRVKQNGQLFVAGTKQDGTLVEFNVNGTLPTDQWVDLEMGLQSQNGPGVKRAFSFLVNGHFYGWYRQGRMDNETYDRIAYGILDTNSADSLEVYVDDWFTTTSNATPNGPDLRSTEILQSHNFQDGNGENVQLDWSTWQNDIHITNDAGIYSNSDRIQAGHNLDKMPDITNGWAEIEIGWSGITPPTNPNSYFGPMVGFHKEVNREENLEVIPIGNGNGMVDLAFEAWTNGEPTIFASWPMPEASIGQGSHIPEPGDIIRTKWQMTDTNNIHVQTSFFDASANQWYPDIISGTYNISNLSGGVNLNDGFHKASSVTIDTTYYSIRRYQVGVLDTYLLPPGASPTPQPSATPIVSISESPTLTPIPSVITGSWERKYLQNYEGGPTVVPQLELRLNTISAEVKTTSAPRK